MTEQDLLQGRTQYEYRDSGLGINGCFFRFKDKVGDIVAAIGIDGTFYALSGIVFEDGTTLSSGNVLNTPNINWNPNTNILTVTGEIDDILVGTGDAGYFEFHSTGSQLGNALECWQTIDDGSPAVDDCAALRVWASSGSTNTVEEVDSVVIEAISNDNIGTITNTVALKIKDQTAALGTNYAIQTGLGLVSFGDTVFLLAENPPLTATSPGLKGQMAFDDANKYMYRCVADNTWVRIQLSTW